MTALASDLRLAVRRLLRRPGFTAIVVLSLSLGIGPNAAIFSLARALLESATPYPDPNRVAAVWFTPPETPGARTLATDANCAALRQRSRAFQHLGCVLPDTTASLADLTTGDAPSRIGATRISGQAFTAGIGEALGVPLVLGRWFIRDEELRAEPVMVISHRLWQRHFGGTADIIGRQVRVTNQSLASEAVSIVGVAPDGFQLFSAQTDYWLPLADQPAGRASAARRLLVIGRLRPGMTIPQVQAEMNAIAAALAEETPFTNRGWGIRVEPIPETIQGGVGRPLRILQAVVAFVLLIACGNVAGLLLADGVARSGETALRSALGASRGQVIRQWLTQSVLLSILGGGLGLLLAWSGLRVLRNSLPAGVPGLDAVGLNADAVAFAVMLSILSAVIFGLAPALRASRAGAAEILIRSARSAGVHTSGHRLRSAFVVGQIALAFLLSIGAGLMIQSLVRLRAVDTGVDTTGVMTFQVRFSGREYIRDPGRSTPSGAPETQLMARLPGAAEQVRERLAGLTGVETASAMSAAAPLSGVARRSSFERPGGETTGGQQRPMVADWFPILGDYFRTLRVPVVRGREFNASDTAAGLPAAIVNRALADELWPGQDPIGREIQLRLLNEPRRRIVGVVANVRHGTRQEGAARQIYVPFAQLAPLQSGAVAHGLELLTFVVRFSGDPTPLPAAFRRIVAEIEPAEPVTDIQPLDHYVDAQLGGFRQYALLLVLFGSVAVLLAILGAYGLMTHMVSQRTQEIGIRMALGATRGQAVLLILRRGLVLMAAGLVVGVGAARALTGILASYLWEVSPTDPWTFTAVLAILAAACLLACYTAARRVVKIDPAVAMRAE
jgi:putative ABC transport system permease protein